MPLRANQLSVIIPTYNDAENLHLCLAALTQARGDLPVDIIVIDDGSADETDQIARPFDVRYVRSERNQGQSRSRNYGARLTAGEYLLFVDSDVQVYPDCFQKISAFLENKPPPGQAGIQGVFALEHPYPEWPSQFYNLIQHVVYRKPACSAGVNTSFLLIARHVFEELGGFREDLWYLEDCEFGQRLHHRGYYLARGPIEFIHRKRTGWSWLFHAHVLGGRMHHHLKKQAGRMPTNNKIDSPQQVGANRALLKWLAAGFTMFAATLFLLTRNSTLLAVIISIAAILMMWLLADCASLLRIRRSPWFVVTGIAVCLLVPWLVIAGRIIGCFSPPLRREHKFWRVEKSPDFLEPAPPSTART